MNQKVERDVIMKNVSRLAVYEGSMLDEKSRFFWKDKKKRKRDSVFYVTMKREEYARTTMLIGIGIYIVEEKYREGSGKTLIQYFNVSRKNHRVNHEDTSR